jgi:exosortase
VQDQTNTTTDLQRQTTRPSWVLPVALLSSAALFWAYMSSFELIFWKWSNDPNYSHGFFVIPIAIVVLWQRRERLDPASVRPTWIGLVVLAGLLAFRAYLYERNEQVLEAATIPLAVCALALTIGGWRFLWWALPAFLFLFFMLPMPEALNNLLALQLQGLATDSSCAVLQAMGLPALTEGHVIYVGSEQMEVAAACNGLSMLLTFLTLIAAVILLADLSIWEKIVLAISAVPIALISNIIRIVVTGWAFYQFGPDTVVVPGWTIERLTHDPAGWAMMPIALALVWMELRLLSWLVIEEQVGPSRPSMVLPRPATASGPLKK